jgi:putative chitinase
MTIKKLQKCLPHAKPENIEKYGAKLIEAMERYEINTDRRQAAFLAQIAHESGSLRYVEEIASGEAYEGRKDLGNTEPGDGVRFKGRGFIQITGRANYKDVSDELTYNFIAKPEDLAFPGPACYSACWFWWSRHLNRLADIDAFEKITRRINGGINGYEDRCKHWETAKKALGVDIKIHESPRPI